MADSCVGDRRYVVNCSRNHNFTKKEIDFEKYEREFEWNYRNAVATKLPIKSTVSKIKEIQNEGIDFFDLTNKESFMAVVDRISDLVNQLEKLLEE